MLEMFGMVILIIGMVIISIIGIYVVYMLIFMIPSAQIEFSRAMHTSNPNKNIKEIWIWSPLLMPLLIMGFVLVFGTILAKVSYLSYFIAGFMLTGILVLSAIVLIKLNNQYKYFLAENNLYQNQDIKKYKSYLGWFYYISIFFNLISSSE